MIPPPRVRLVLASAVVAFATAGVAPAARPAGRAPAAPAKSLIYAGWHGSVTPTPQFIQDNFDFLESRPFDGLVVYLRDPSLVLNATVGVMTGTAMAYDDIVQILDPIRNLPFSRLRDNFGYVIGVSPPDFFDDWSVTIQNFANLARALHEAGLRGFVFDNEQYFDPWGYYPNGVAYPQMSLAEYQAQASMRGQQVMAAMIAEFPDIQVITLHGPYISDPYSIQQMGFPGVLPNYLLVGPFFAGFLQGTGGTAARSVDGGELYWFRTPQEFADSYDLRRTGIASDAADCAFIPTAQRPSWPGLSSIGFGLLDRPFMNADMTPQILTTTIKNAMDRADRWVWYYTEDRTYLLPESGGGATQEWVKAVFDGLPPPPDPPPAPDGRGRSSCGLVGAEAVLAFLALLVMRSRIRRSRQSTSEDRRTRRFQERPGRVHPHTGRPGATASIPSTRA